MSNNACTSYELSRRQLLMRSVAGMGVLGAAGPGGLGSVLASSAADAPHPLAPKAPHFAPRAKRVIFFFMTGGASHVDSFDPKPKLQANDGKTIGRRKRKLMASPWDAKPRGQSGIETTDLFPHLAGMTDDMCFLRSLHGDKGDHFEATLHMHTGSKGEAKPGIGAWVSYGLGTDNTNLPAHVVFAEDKPYAGSQVWSSNFLPAYHQGTRVVPGDDPIPHLRPSGDQPAALQRKELEMLRRMNERHMSGRPQKSELAARNLAFNTAYSMQNLAPDLFDLSGEHDHTLGMYGVERGDNQSFGWQCLMARRMAEQGVRFIELIDTGSSGNWDAHGNIKGHERLAKQVDKPIAGLMKDLKQRGMLDDTLIVWCTEFGRTPHATGTGRGHHNNVFTCWLAGGGVKGGHVHGASDEIGNGIAEDPVHVHDFHATILHLLGLDHTRLTFRHAGRDFRLTDVYGNVVHDIMT